MILKYATLCFGKEVKLKKTHEARKISWHFFCNYSGARITMDFLPHRSGTEGCFCRVVENKLWHIFYEIIGGGQEGKEMTGKMQE